MKNTLWLFPSLLLLLGSLFSGGCYYDNLQELHPEILLNSSCDTSSTMSYLTHIEPILSNSCGENNSCHSAQGASGGVVLENYAGVKSSVVNGKFLSSILWDGNAAQMPKNSPTKLRNCSIVQIQKWINAGAADN